MSNKTLYKIIGLTLMLLLLVPFSGLVYFGLYSINNYYPETYQRYATSGKDEKNIFFSKEVDKNTKVIDSIKCVDFTEALKDGRIQTACKIINENKNKIRKNLMLNEKYMKYLDDNELTIDNFFSYTERIEAIDNNFLKAGFFLGWLIIITICVVIFGWRSKFYLFAGIIYIVHVFSQFTGMQSDTLLYYAFFQKYDTYNNFISTMPILISALTESITTFIILDYLFQINGSKKIKIINNFISKLNIIIDRLESRTVTPTEVKESWKKNSHQFLKMCNREISKHNRYKILDKVFRQITKSDEEKYLLIQAVQNEINDIAALNTANSNGYDNKIRRLREKIISLKNKY